MEKQCLRWRMNSMLRSKRGEMAYYVRWAFFTIPMLIIIFVTLAIWLSGVLYPTTDTFNADAALLTYQLVYSPQGLGAIDASGRPLPGVVFESKLLSPTVTDSLAATFPQTGELPMAANILIGSHELFYPSQTAFNHLAQLRGFTGPSATIELKTESVVLIRANGQDIPAPMHVTVLRAKGDS
jgi:hypothetical protein